MPKVLTCASRQRGKKPNTYHKIEFGGEIANSVTTINTDSMITKEVEEEWKDINNHDSDNYEHIVAYVHFDAGTGIRPV